MNHNLKILALCFLIGQNSFAQNKQAEIRKYFSALAENQQFNGNILVAEKGKIIYEKSFGYADPSTKTLNTLSTQFPICSITKTFVATSILQLAEAGKLSVDDYVIKYLPDFPYVAVTIRQLLSHTSGLPEFYGTFDSLALKYPDSLFTNKDFINCYKAVSKPLMFQPGDKFNYNNANYVVLSIIITRITGLSIDSYIATHILKPCRMNHTFMCDYFHLPNDVKKKLNIAVPYYLPHEYSDETVRTDTIPFLVEDAKHFNFSGFGDIISTIHDLLLYDEALYTGKLLQTKTLDEAYTPVKLNNGDINPGVWGLGWQIDKVGKMVNHGGGMAGVYLSFTRNYEKHQTAIVFSISREQLSRPVALNAIKILNNERVPLPKKSAAHIYAVTLIKYGKQEADKFIAKAKNDTLNYFLSENELNALGYEFMGAKFVYKLPVKNHLPEALEVFKKTTELFPESWNAYDSYGEALLKNGQKEEAIRMYQKSIELNPKNDHGKKVLDDLLKQ